MDVTLPNGQVIRGVPEGTSKEVIMQKAISAGLAAPSDFANVMPATAASPDQRFASPRARRAKEIQQEEAQRKADVLASLPEGQREIIENLSPLDAFMIGMGKGFTDIGRGVGIVDQATESERQSFEALQQYEPTATGGGEILGQAAPFVPVGIGAGAIPVTSTLGRAAVTGGLGATEGAIIARGEGREAGEVAAAAGLGGAVASALELGLPVIGRVGGKLIRKVTGKPPKGSVVTKEGLPTSELQNALDELGVKYDDLVNEARTVSEGLTPEQSARQAFMRSQGIEPTRAQITREKSDFIAQQEAAKVSSRIADVLSDQNRVLSSRFDNVIKGTTGDLGTETNTMVDAVSDKAIKLDQEISNLYNKAREVAPEAKNIKFDALSTKLRELAPDNEVTGGAIKSIRGTLNQRGALDKWEPVGKVDVDTAEEIRKKINSLYDEKNPQRNIALRELKEALDEDVFKSAGKDVFEQARKAKAEFERGLSKAKINKFDQNKRNLVRDVLENKVDPDQFVQKTMFSKYWRKEDIGQLVNYVKDAPNGEQAIKDFRAQILESIKDKSFTGADDATGLQTLKVDNLDKAIKSIGYGKLKAVFEPKEIKFLDDLVKVGRIRQPIDGTALGEGPTALAINKLMSRSSIPFLDEIKDAWGAFKTSKKGKLALQPPRMKDITPLDQASRAVALTGAAGTVAAEDEDL